METPPPPPALDRAASSASSADAAPQATFTKDEVLAMLTADKFKKFAKKKCGECGVACMKRFASSSPMIVKPMLNTFWCKECGRLLCENHRQQHTCERVDAEKARKQAMTHEQIAEEVAKAEMQKELADAEKTFSEEVEKLQKTYEKLSKEKDETKERINDDDFKFAKAVKKAAAKASATDEL